MNYGIHERSEASKAETPGALMSAALSRHAVKVAYDFLPLSQAPRAREALDSRHKALSFNWRVTISRDDLAEAFHFSCGVERSPTRTSKAPQGWPAKASKWPWPALRIETETGLQVAHVGGALVSTDKPIRFPVHAAMASVYGAGMAFTYASPADWCEDFGIDTGETWAGSAFHDSVAEGRRLRAVVGAEGYAAIGEAARAMWSDQDRKAARSQRWREARRDSGNGW